MELRLAADSWEAKSQHGYAREPIHIVEPKGWGREVWIANNPQYCGKILEIKRKK